MSRPRWKGLLAGAGALAVAAALVTGAIIWIPTPATTAAPTPSAAEQGPTRTPTKKQDTGKRPSTPATKTRATRTSGSKPTASRRQPTPTSTPTTAPSKARTTAAAAGTVRLASLTLDGQQAGNNCYSPSLFPVALLKGPSGKQVEYGYRWVVDGQDEGWKTDWVTGTTKNQRNPFGAFDPGRHTIVFHLLTPSKDTRRVSFTVCS